MSIYSLIDTPVPTIAYCALHQARPEIPREEYIKTMNELHQSIVQESRDINAAYAKHLSDTLARESQSLQNTLSHFLQTPISSDNDDVQRILVESFERFKNQILDGSSVGLLGSLESKVFFASSKKSLEKKLLKNGKTYLDGLGFTTSKGCPDIFESTFIVHGGMNLDILEHIVRDRLGIYATIHGKHIKEFSGYSYALYNLAFAKGEMPASDGIQKYNELTFHFSKPDVEYAPFRSGLTEVLEKLNEALDLKHVSLWQRKLGLGVGREFVLRVISEKSEVAGDTIEWLNGYEEKGFVKESIIGSGQLLVKELLSR
jgi:hypothetical protein